MAALQTQRPKVTSQDGLKAKLPDRKRVLVGSHGQGRCLPGQKSAFTFAEPVDSLLASVITNVWNIRVIPLFQTPRGTTSHRNLGPQTSHCYLVSPRAFSAGRMFLGNSPAPTSVKEICVSPSHSSSRPRAFPALLSPHSPTHRPRISRRPPLHLLFDCNV